MRKMFVTALSIAVAIAGCTLQQCRSVSIARPEFTVWDVTAERCLFGNEYTFFVIYECNDGNLIKVENVNSCRDAWRYLRWTDSYAYLVKERICYDRFYTFTNGKMLLQSGYFHKNHDYLSGSASWNPSNTPKVTQCFHCEEMGHYSFNCPRYQCSYCSQFGHSLKSDCKVEYKGRRRKSKTRYSGVLKPKIEDQYPKLKKLMNHLLQVITPEHRTLKK